MSNYYTSNIDNCTFWCSSDSADYSYIVECERDDDYEKAVEIAERELTYYGDPENSPDYDYYYNVGYVEVVREAFNKEGIEATFYTKEE